jgi:hypothetical protein
MPPPPTPILLVAVLEENVEALLLATELTNDVDSEDMDVEDICDGIKLSVALLARLDFPVVRLNMCGILALLKDPAAPPSGGWSD